jgi:hypothetical protein
MRNESTAAALMLTGFLFAESLFAQNLAAQTAQPAAKQSGATESPAKSIGLFAYPKNQQSADQQLRDENECFASSKQQSGVDPQAPPPATKTEGSR